MIDSVFQVGKKYDPDALLEESEYDVKAKKVEKFTISDIGIFFRRI